MTPGFPSCWSFLESRGPGKACMGRLVSRPGVQALSLVSVKGRQAAESGHLAWGCCPRGLGWGCRARAKGFTKGPGIISYYCETCVHKASLAQLSREAKNL